VAGGVTIQIESRILADHLRLECNGMYSQDAVLRLYERAFALAAEAGRDAADNPPGTLR